MIQTLTKNWWLLGLCGVLDAIISVIYLIMYDAGPDATPFGGWNAEVVLLCRLSAAAGVCSIAAGIWKSNKGISWLVSCWGWPCGCAALARPNPARGEVLSPLGNPGHAH